MEMHAADMLMQDTKLSAVFALFKDEMSETQDHKDALEEWLCSEEGERVSWKRNPEDLQTRKSCEGWRLKGNSKRQSFWKGDWRRRRIGNWRRRLGRRSMSGTK